MKRKAVSTGRFLLVILVAGAALIAGAWLGGWRPPAAWRLPAGLESGEPEPRETISETERRSLDEILRERGSAKGH